MVYVPCGSACMALERVSRCLSRIVVSAYDSDHRQNDVAAELPQDGEEDVGDVDVLLKEPNDFGQSLLLDFL